MTKKQSVINKIIEDLKGFEVERIKDNVFDFVDKMKELEGAEDLIDNALYVMIHNVSWLKHEIELPLFIYMKMHKEWQYIIDEFEEELHKHINDKPIIRTETGVYHFSTLENDKRIDSNLVNLSEDDIITYEFALNIKGSLNGN